MFESISDPQVSSADINEVPGHLKLNFKEQMLVVERIYLVNKVT